MQGGSKQQAEPGKPDGRQLPSEFSSEVTLEQSDAERPSQAPTAQVGLPDWSVGSVILDDYEVEKLLGRGGMGAVYLVCSRSMGERFAVKRIRPELVRDVRHRRSFLRELLTWSELPEHPNLAPLRFFRLVGEEMLIFAEYASGGSLQDWIQAERLQGLPGMLDVAIQVARGLAAAHRRGVVHRDMKPGNVLLTPDGRALVTDFGLSQATASGCGPVQGEDAATVEGFTPAYCSPEQVAGEAVTPASDVWSWGLCLLAMLSGGVSWGSGAAAAEALDDLLEQGRSGECVTVPPGLDRVLRRCFRAEPGERWAGMDEVTEELIRIYAEEAGEPYARLAQAPVELPPSPDDGTEDRRFEQLLEVGAEAMGLSPEEKAAAWLPPARTHRGRMVSRLARLEELQRPLEQALRTGRIKLEVPLADLLNHKGAVLGQLQDLPGSLQQHARAIELLQQNLKRPGPDARWEQLGASYLSHGSALGSLGRHADAVVQLEQAVATLRQAVRRLGPEEVAANLGRAYQNLGIARFYLRDNRGAEVAGRRALKLWDWLVKRIPSPENRNDLARCLKYNGVIHRMQQRPEQASDVYDRAIQILEGLAREQPETTELQRELAHLLANKANLMAMEGQPEEALPFYHRSEELLEELVVRKGRRDLADDLAQAGMNRGNALGALKRQEEAIPVFRRAVGFLDDLVGKEGRRELAPQQAIILLNLGASLIEMGRPGAALIELGRSREIFQRVVELEGRKGETGRFALVLQREAEALTALGRDPEALELFEQVIPMLEVLLEQTRGDLTVGTHLAGCLVGRGEIHRRAGEPVIPGTTERVAELIPPGMPTKDPRVEREVQNLRDRASALQ